MTHDPVSDAQVYLEYIDSRPPAPKYCKVCGEELVDEEYEICEYCKIHQHD